MVRPFWWVKYIYIFVFIVFFNMLSRSVCADVSVVATIQPIHSLVSAVLQGAGEPYLLVRGKNSPHTGSLRPSDAAILQTADLIFWVGPQLELFLERSLTKLPKKARLVSLSQIAGVTLLPYRQEEMQSEEHAEEHASHTHLGGMDMHIWLDPQNAKGIVVAIGAHVSQLDPKQASLYQKNVQATLTRLEVLQTQLEHILTPVKEWPFMAFHDAYQYFSVRFGLNYQGSVTTNPDRTPGAARLTAIQSVIRSSHTRCILSEAQFQPTLVQSLAKDTHLTTATIDPLGATLDPGPELYFKLMENLATTIATCLNRVGT
ncbi:MAG: zinc ABC transporter substrate-binding protein [Magnetococcus sp. DMHC-6]